jgi:hypothetical protein
VGPEGLDQLAADAERGVEAPDRVLEDHADVPAPDRPELPGSERGEVLPPEPDAAAHPADPRGQQAQHRQGDQRLARAALAHHAQDPAAIDGEPHAVQQRHAVPGVAGFHPEVADLEERPVVGRGRGHSRPSMPSIWSTWLT